VSPVRTGVTSRASESRLAELVGQARGGDREALDAVVRALGDDIYGLALRMTGNVADAEDASQEILVKIVTRLDSFRGDASLRTWAYRVAVRHILDRKKGRLESLSLDFERFRADLVDGLREPAQAEDPLVVQEVKLGCTLAMLTCLDRDHRLAYVLGEVFDLPGDVAAQVSETSSDVHRQRLSRARRQLEAFTESYCGIVNERAPCRCDRRVERAVELGRIQRKSLPLAGHARRSLTDSVRKMEDLHTTAALFRSHPDYAAPDQLAARIRQAVATGLPGGSA
jgi:RNA polymerase sigma factor (sigma-70 family)